MLTHLELWITVRHDAAIGVGHCEQGSVRAEGNISDLCLVVLDHLHLLNAATRNTVDVDLKVLKTDRMMELKK